MWLSHLFENNVPARGAGCVFLAADSKRILLAHRSREVSEPGTYATFGGGSNNPSETALATMKREMHEETGYEGSFKTKPLLIFVNDMIHYSNFLVIVPTEFEPHLNYENQGYIWCEFGAWPSPLHPGLKALLHDPASLMLLTHKSLLKKDSV